MLFDAIRRRRREKADSQQAWLARWQSLVPEENRNVPVTVEGQTRIAYIQINQFVVMLQDGLLMKAHFFDVCEVFQKAGNYGVTILIQHRQVPPEVTDLGTCRLRVLQRVTWAESDDDTQMVPGRTEFFTAGKPATPEELLHWLTGTTLANL